MPIAVKVDEDLPTGVVEALRRHGLRAHGVHEQGVTGYPDERLWTAVQHEERLLISADKGFADILRYPPGTHHGVILFRLDNESRQGYIDLTEHLLATMALEDLVGATTVVTRERIRVRRG